LPENYSSQPIGGGGGNVQAQAQGVLTVQAVADRYGLSTDQVEQFCRDEGIAKHGDHFDIPASMLEPQLRTWAASKGYTLAGST